MQRPVTEPNAGTQRLTLDLHVKVPACSCCVGTNSANATGTNAVGTNAVRANAASLNGVSDNVVSPKCSGP